MNSQNWNAQEYNTNAAFVAQLGNFVLEILAPKPGENILDLGCGDGKLTLEIQKYGCHVLGIDSSEDMINATKKLGIEAKVISGDRLNFVAEFDAIFSNLCFTHKYGKGCNECILFIKTKRGIH